MGVLCLEGLLNAKCTPNARADQSDWHVLTCGTLITTTLQDRYYYYYYSHFRDKEMEAQRGEELAQRHTARKGQMWVSNPHSLLQVCTCNLPVPGFSLRPTVTLILLLLLFELLNCTRLSQPHGLIVLPGSSVHEISQARRLEWVAISSSRGSSRPRDRTHVSRISRQILYPWAAWKAQSTQIRTGFSKDCLIKRWAKDLNRHLTKDIQMVSVYLQYSEKKKKSLTSTQSSPDQHSMLPKLCLCL